MSNLRLKWLRLLGYKPYKVVRVIGLAPSDGTIVIEKSNGEYAPFPRDRAYTWDLLWPRGLNY